MPGYEGALIPIPGSAPPVRGPYAGALRRYSEDEFRRWYGERAQRLGLSPDPDDPRHAYDYRAAYRAGAEPDAEGHWPSEHKAAEHPRRYLMRNGVVTDTATGEPVGEKNPDYASARAAAEVAGEGAGWAPEAAEESPRSPYAGALRRVPGSGDQQPPRGAAGQPGGKARIVEPWKDPENPLVQAAARGEALPTAAMPALEGDPGVARMAGASLLEGTVRPLVGWAETLGELAELPFEVLTGQRYDNPATAAMAGLVALLRDPKGALKGGGSLDVPADGMTPAMRAHFEKVREAYLAQDPGWKRSAVGLLSEFGGQLPLYLPGAGVGATAAEKVAAAGGGKLAQRIAAGAAPGALHGAAVGIGATAGQDLEDRALAVLGATAIGGLTGGLGGARAGLRPDAPAPAARLEAGAVDGLGAGGAARVESPEPGSSSSTSREVGKQEPAARDPDAAIADYAQRNLARLSEGANPKPEGGSQAARTAWVNRDAALEDLGGEEMRHAVQRARGAPEAAKTPLLHGIYERTPDGGFRRDEQGNPVRLARSLREILGDVDRRDLNVYLAAAQDMELGRQGKPGVREEESAAALAALSDKYGVDVTPDGPRLKVLAERADELRDWFTQATLDPLIEAGRITADDKGRMLAAANGSYAPMRKLADIIADEAEGYSQGAAGGRYQAKGNPVKRRTRSYDEEGGRNIMPVEEMARRAYQVGIWTERQRVANTLASMTERDAAAAAAGAAERGVASVVARAQVQPKPIAHLTVEDLREMGLPDDALGGMEDFTHVLWRPTKDQPPGTFVAYEGGKPVYYEAPEAVLTALNGERPQVAGFLARLAQSQSRLVRAGSVFAPAFIGTNVLKDQATAFMFTPGLMYKPFWSAAKGLAAVMRKGDLYQEAVASGSLHGTLVSGDRAKMQTFIDEALGTEGSWKRFLNPVESLATLSEALENGTRVGVFLEARRRGLSIDDARDLTREATIDFSRKGELGEKVNRYAAFFNAGMQGLSKVYRALGEDVALAAKGDKAAQKRATDLYLKAALAVTVPSVLLWAKNHDDPDYQRIPQWERDRMWHLFKIRPGHVLRAGAAATSSGLSERFGVGERLQRLLRDEPMWVTLPKPFEVGWLFGSAAERMLDFTVDRDPRAVVEFLSDMVGQIAPDPTPNIVKPVFENVVNKSLHFDRPIVPEHLHESEGYPNTSPTIMAAARAADAIGLDEIPGARQLASPLRLQNLAQGYTGGLGREAVRLADVAGEATGLYEERPDLPARLTEIPGVGGFGRGVLSPEARGSRSEPVDRFYEVAKEIQQLAGKHGRALDRKDRQGWNDARDLQRKHPEYRYANYTRQITKDLAAKNDELRRVLADRSPSMSPERRALLARQIELEMSAIADRALKRIANR